MTKIKIHLNWGLQPEIKMNWGIFPHLPGRTKEIDFPTPFYEEAFQELLDEGLVAHLIKIEIEDRKHALTFDGSNLQLLEDSTT